MIGELLWVGNEQIQAGKGDYPIARGSNPAHCYESPTLHLSRRGFRSTLAGDGLSISSVTDVLNLLFRSPITVLFVPGALGVPPG